MAFYKGLNRSLPKTYKKSKTYDNSTYHEKVAEETRQREKYLTKNK